jgi:hypothetical protein
MEKDEKVIDIKERSVSTFINYITDLAVECRKKCITNKTLDIDLNNDDIVKAFGYAYTHGYLKGQSDALGDMRKEVKKLESVLDKNKENK